MIFWNPRRGAVDQPNQSSNVDSEQKLRIHGKHGETCGDRLIWSFRYVECCRTPFLSHNFEDMVQVDADKDKFSLSLSPSASDSRGNTKFESQKVPLSSWTEQQPFKNGETCNGRLLIIPLRMEQ